MAREMSESQNSRGEVARSLCHSSPTVSDLKKMLRGATVLARRRGGHGAKARNKSVRPSVGRRSIALQRARSALDPESKRRRELNAAAFAYTPLPKEGERDP